MCTGTTRNGEAQKKIPIGANWIHVSYFVLFILFVVELETESEIRLKLLTTTAWHTSLAETVRHETEQRSEAKQQVLDLSVLLLIVI